MRLEIIYLTYTHEKDLALNNLQELICHETKPNLDIVTGVLKKYISSPFLFIIYLDYVLQASIDPMKENGFHPHLPKKGKKQVMPSRNNDEDYADDLTLFANAPAQD